MRSPSACDAGGTVADSQTIPSTQQRGEAALSLTPCLLKEKAVLSLCCHQASQGHCQGCALQDTCSCPVVLGMPLEKAFCQKCCQIFHQLCMWNSAHRSSVCFGVFQKPLFVPAPLGMSRNRLSLHAKKHKCGLWCFWTGW